MVKCSLELRVIRGELIDQSEICASRYRYVNFMVPGMAKCIHRVNLSEREPGFLNRKTWHRSRCKYERTQPLDCFCLTCRYWRLAKWLMFTYIFGKKSYCTCKLSQLVTPARLRKSAAITAV